MDNNLIHNLNDNKNFDGLTYSKFFLFIIIAIILGIAFGFGLTKIPKKRTTKTNTVKAEKIVGITDKKTFKDQAEGILKEGGVDGEGSFHLVRPGGESQNVYLTSTTVDLSQYIGKKVRVWGETFAAKKAGWLMNVGQLEIIK